MKLVNSVIRLVTMLLVACSVENDNNCYYVNASVFTSYLTNVDYSFTNPVPVDGPLANVINNGGTLSWGIPAQTQSSSFVIVEPPAVNVPPGLVVSSGVEFPLGHFTHNNFPILGASTFSTSLQTSATFAFQMGPVVFQVDLDLVETVNDPINGICAEGGIPPCPDRVTFNNNQPMSVMTTVGNDNIVLTILGFKINNSLVTSFVSLENASTEVTLWAILEAEGIDTGGGKDPHFITWSKERYDFHGECDLIYMHNPDFHHQLGLDIHMRTKIRRQWSYVDVLAIRIGDDTLEVKGGYENQYWMNGVSNVDLPTVLGGFVVEYERANSNQRSFKILLDHDQMIEIRTYKDFVSVTIHKGLEHDFGNSTGLSGSYASGTKLARDGISVMEDPIALGMEWQRRPDDPLLFRSIEGTIQYPQQCQLPSSFQQVQRGRRRLGESSINPVDAEIACSNVDPLEHDNCVFDVLLTADLDMAAGAY
jgi:hypothetical protein